jgi:transposase InsO family protein
MQDSLEGSLVIAALTDASQRWQPAAGFLHHSDRGSQYASSGYQALLAKAQMIGSMSRKGNYWANAVMESFFTQRVPVLKAELPLSVFPTHAAARTAVFDYIERFYNRRRCHSSLGYRSPADYEAQESVCTKAA